MIQLRPGDLVAVKSGSGYHYALILDRVRLFGGNWTYVFHKSSKRQLTADQVLDLRKSGFHAFVDFIHAKREGRLDRLAHGVDTSRYSGPGYLKRTAALGKKAKLWFISDMRFNELRRVETLSEEEKTYPLEQTIDDALMIDRAEKRWTPTQDVRI